jgi:hypothetical protein
MPGISRVVIDQEFASVGIKITPAQMQITTPRPHMKIDQEMPRMEIQSEKPTFDVDMSRVHAETGLKNPRDLLNDMRGKANTVTMDYIGEKVAEGDYAASIEQPGNRIAQFAKSKAMEASNISLNAAPRSLPEVSWNKGSIDITWSNHKFNIEWDGEYTPEVVIDPRYSVEVFLRNRPSITITVEEWDTADSAGRLIDARL